MEESCENLFTIMVASGVTDKTTFTVAVRIVGTVTAAADTTASVAAAAAATAADATSVTSVMAVINAVIDGYDGKKEHSV